MEQLIAQLESSGYGLSQKIRIKEMLPFLQENLKANNLAVWGYRIGMVVLLAAAGGFVGYNIADHLAWALAGIGWAFATLLLLIPLHELIHAAAYWALGARDIRFGAVWKSFMFYAGAHGFVANRRAFWWVALSPMVTITLAGIAIAVFAPMQVKVVAMMVTALHWLMCGGDIALISYFLQNKDQEVITFDDLEKGESYFYIKSQTIS